MWRVRSGRPRRLLGPTIGAAALLAFAALVLWGVAMVDSWASTCPNETALDSTGLDKGLSAWPPGAQCLANPPAHGSFVHQVLPWAPWAVTILVVGAAAVLLIGLVASIRDLRTARDREVGRTFPATLAVPERSWIGGDVPAGAAPAEAGEGDPPAIAA